MNNILKEIQHLKAINTTSYDKGSGTRYNTNYDLLDKNGKLLASKRRQTCFNKLFLTHGDLYTKFIETGEAKKLIIYALDQDVSLTEVKLISYIKEIKKLGLHFTFKTIDKYDLNKQNINSKGLLLKQECYHDDNEEFYYDKTIDQVNEIICFKNQKVYIIEIDLSRHKSLLGAKILAYYFRHIYEFNAYKAIEMYFDYKKKYPKESMFRILPFMLKYVYNQLGKSVGHVLFELNKIYADVSLKKFKELINQEVIKEFNEGYNDHGLTNIYNGFTTYFLEYNSRWGNDTCNINVDINIDKSQSINDFIKSIEQEKNLSNISPYKTEYKYKLIKKRNGKRV